MVYMALDWVGLSFSFIMELSCEVWEIKRGLPTSPVGIFQAKYRVQPHLHGIMCSGACDSVAIER
jgi:hypothetical protein